MKKLLLFAVALICGSLNVTAQLVGGNAYLQGQYVEIGMNQCGSWGTTNDAPAGYHARTGQSVTTTGNSKKNLGFVADPDKDGWTVGSPNKYNGDYFMSTVASDGWSISINGIQYNNHRRYTTNVACKDLSNGNTSMPGVITAVQSTGNTRTSKWVGAGSGIQLTKTASLTVDKLYFIVNVSLKNTTSASIDSIYYAEYIDPEHDYFYQDSAGIGTYGSKNGIIYQNPTDGKSLVRALAGVTQNYLGLGSKDCRSKAFRGTNNYYPYSSSAVALYKGTTNDTLSGIDTTNKDYYIGTGFNIGTIAAGDSTTFTYAIILKATDFDEALASTDPGFTANGSTYESGDTVITCFFNPLNIRITNGEYYNWTWSPATGLNTTTGLNVTANPTQTVTYIATGTGPCGTKYDTVTIRPVLRLYVDSSIATSGSGASWTSPMKTVSQALNFANTTCINEIWVRKGTYYPMTDLNTVAASRDSSLRILRNGIKLYGGFSGTETTLVARTNIAGNPTVLSGDINTLLSNADNSYHVVRVQTGNSTIADSVVIDGFVINNGNANVSASGLDGGGILADDNTGSFTLSIQNATVANNRASGNGAGMYVKAPLLRIGNSTFSTDTTTSGQGGAVYAREGQLLISNTRFLSNTAGTRGGALSLNDEGVIASNCVFSNNVSPLGGAIRDEAYSKSTTYINNVFSGNKATSMGGGGISKAQNSTGKDTLINNVFIGNTCLNAGQGGGAVNVFNGTHFFSNNTFFADSANSNGGAIRFEGSSAANTTLANNIFWKNGAATGADINVSATTQSNNLFGTNPQFVNEGSPIGADNIWATTDDGLRLTPCSPAINTGSNTLVPAGITTDITGTARIQNTTVEMGAYEMPYNGTGLPSTTIAMNPTNPVCSNTAVVFTATTVAPGSIPVYQWYKNGVAVGTNQNTYTFNSWNANDSVWVIHTNNDCSLSDTSNKRYIQIEGVPAQPGAISGNASPCPGSTQTYAVSAVTGAVTYTWTVPAGWVITAGQGTASVTVTAGTAAGDITVTADNSCPVASPVRTLAVTPLTLPVAPAAPTGPVTVCASSTGNVYSTTAVPGATTYTWTVPAGWVITAGQGSTSVTVTAAAGTTSGTIAVSAINSCQTSAAVTLAVSGGSIVPTVSVSGNPGGAICQGTSVTFTATATNGGSAPLYTWRKNGTTVTGAANTYTDAGLNNGDVITVRLNSNAVCVQPDSAVSSVTVTVNPVPAITTATGGNPTSCGGTNGTIALSGNFGSTTGYTVNYSKGGTAQAPLTLASSGGVITLTGLSSGSYSAFTVSRLGCTSASFAGPVGLSNPAPPAAPTASSNSPVCVNGTLNLSANTITGATYSWSGPGGFSATTQNPSLTSIQTAGAGTYSVTATVAGCTSVAGATTVVVNTPPAAPASVSGNATPCSGTSQTYTTGSVTGATSYTWTAPGGWTGTSATASITYTTSVTGGTVEVKANGTCGSSAAASLSVAPVQTLTPSVSVAAPGAPVCQGAKTTFTATPVNGGNAPAYQWKKNGQNVGVNSPAYTDSTLVNGDMITVVMTSNTPCASAASATAATTVVTVLPNVMPGININVAQGLFLCEGAPNTFISNISSGGTNPTYQWYSNGNAIAGATGPNYTDSNFVNNDVISVVLTSTAACRLSDTIRSNEVKLLVYPSAVPTVVVSANPGTEVPTGTFVTFTAIVSPATGPAPTYQWYRNGLAVVGQKSVTYTTNVLQSGDLISVRIGSLGPCANPSIVSSAPVRMSTPAGIQTVGSGWEGTLSLYPNPNSGHFTVAADWGTAHARARVQIELVNALGQTVYRTGAVSEGGKWSVEVHLNEGVANGVYMLRMQRQSDGSTLARPVLIQR